MGRKSPYNGVKLKVKKIPIDLEQLFTEISTAYGNSEDKDRFIAEFHWFVETERYLTAVIRTVPSDSDKSKEVKYCF